MNKQLRGDERDQLLADVAEMYYEKELTQAEISRAIGLTRSAVSRLLTEARQKGIVEINIRRPLHVDHGLASALQARFDLPDAYVIAARDGEDYGRLRRRLGQAAASVLVERLRPQMTCGVAWGTTVSATIEALHGAGPLPLRVVQLVGVLQSDSHAFNAQALVEIMARKLGGRGVYIYSPFIVEDAATARSLRTIPDVRAALDAAKSCDLVLMGIGTLLHPASSTLYLGGHITLETLQELRAAGAVGDVGGVHIDIQGREAGGDFARRMVGISGPDLLAVPTRIAVAGGAAKAEAILAALRGGYTNLLVTDSSAAQALLQMDAAPVAGRSAAA